MEVVIKSCQGRQILDRFKLSPYKMDTFLAETGCNNICDACGSGVMIEVYEAGRLTFSKKTIMHDSLKRLLKQNKAILA